MAIWLVSRPNNTRTDREHQMVSSSKPKRDDPLRFIEDVSLIIITALNAAPHPAIFGASPTNNTNKTTCTTMVKTRTASKEDEAEAAMTESPRELRQKERNLRRAKNTGKISLDETPINQKIVFDDNVPNDNDETTAEELALANDPREMEVAEDDDDDNEDDAIEEVRGAVAKEQMQTQRHQERSSNVMNKKKKKRKKIQEELDDQFFHELEREQQLSKRQEKITKRKKQNTHNVFMVESPGDVSQPQAVDHNIQVVVLKESQTTHVQMDDDSDDEPSHFQLMYSRQALLDGSDDIHSDNNKKHSSKQKLSSKVTVDVKLNGDHWTNAKAGVDYIEPPQK